jgi:hypothetical protein
MSGKKRGGIEPSRTMRTHIYYNLTVQDVLDEEEFVEKMLIIRRRIIRVFDRSIDPKTKRGVSGNYLMGIGPKLHSLRSFMYKHVHFRGIIHENELPEQYQVLTDYWKKFIISKIIRILIDLQLEEMYEVADLWQMDNLGGIWEIAQTVADEEVLIYSEIASIYNRPRSSKKPHYLDERSFHGKPSKQARRRNKELRQAPGISIGVSDY